jgi:two-component system cell cycle response regulator
MPKVPSQDASHGTARAGQRRRIPRRDQSAQERLHAADARDVIANARDLAALTRDTAAGAREPGARGFQQAVEQDARAAEDRHNAAQDREQAACERLHALVDRELLADALDRAAYDALTGARARAAGLTELDNELDRCRRTGSTLAVAYVDVIGLKALNDSEGHGAGDALLKRVVTLIDDHLRSYDLIIRVGGDEFVCAMSGTTLLDARRRFARVADALAATPGVGAIRTGLASLTGAESAMQLIGRADAELLGSAHGDH